MANAGEGESTADLVFGGHNLIAENGTVLAEDRLHTGLTISEIDVDKLAYERRRMNTFPVADKTQRGGASIDAVDPADGFCLSMPHRQKSLPAR